MNEDEIFEDLPPRLRRQVLAAWSGDQVEDDQPANYEPQFQIDATPFKVAVRILWALPWVVVGLPLTVTIVFAPIGIPLLLIGAWPLYRVFKPKAVIEAET